MPTDNTMACLTASSSAALTSGPQTKPRHHHRHRSADFSCVQDNLLALPKRPSSPSSPRSVALESIPEGRASPTSTSTNFSGNFHPLTSPVSCSDLESDRAKKSARARKHHRRAQSLDGTRSFDSMDQHNVLQQQLLYLREQNDIPKLVSTFNILGNVYFRERQFNEAISNYKQAVTVAEEANSDDITMSLAEAYCNLGTVYWNVDSVDDAIFSLLKGLNILKQLRRPTAAVHYQLGLAYTLNRSFNSAHQHLQTCIDMYQNQELEMARAYCALANLYQQQNQDNRALRSLQYARQIREEYGAPTSVVVEQIGNLHLKIGNLSQALLSFTDLQKQLQNSKAPTSVNRLAQTKSRIEELSFRLRHQLC